MTNHMSGGKQTSLLVLQRAAKPGKQVLHLHLDCLIRLVHRVLIVCNHLGPQDIS